MRKETTRNRENFTSSNRVFFIPSLGILLTDLHELWVLKHCVTEACHFSLHHNTPKITTEQHHHGAGCRGAHFTSKECFPPFFSLQKSPKYCPTPQPPHPWDQVPFYALFHQKRGTHLPSRVPHDEEKATDLGAD